jgi:hypothetical protein
MSRGSSLQKLRAAGAVCQARRTVDNHLGFDLATA